MPDGGGASPGRARRAAPPAAVTCAQQVRRRLLESSGLCLLELAGPTGLRQPKRGTRPWGYFCCSTCLLVSRRLPQPCHRSADQGPCPHPGACSTRSLLPRALCRFPASLEEAASSAKWELQAWISPCPRGGAPFRAVTRGPGNRVLIDQEACSPPCRVLVCFSAAHGHTPQHGRRPGSAVHPGLEQGGPRLPVLDARRRAQGRERQASFHLLNQVSCHRDRWAESNGVGSGS